MLPRPAVGARLLLLLAALAVCLPEAPARAQTLLSGVEVVGGPATPVTVPLELPDAGDYTLALVDQNFPVVDGFDGLDGLLVDEADAVVGRVALDAPLTFTALAGAAYRLIVVGELRAAGAALFTVRVDDADGTEVFTAFESLIGPIAPVDSSSLLETLAVVDAGDYTLRVEDFAFPEPLEALQVLLIRQVDGAPITAYDLADDGPVVTRALPDLASGGYELAVFVSPDDARAAGVFGVELRGGPFGDALVARSFVVTSDAGTALGVTPFEAGATGSYTLTLTDFGFPASLASLNGLVLRDGQSVARLETPPASTAFNALEDTAYQLVVDAVPDPFANAGAFGVNVAGGPFDETLVDSVGTVEAAGDDDSIDITFGVPAAGDYEVALVDFGFPSDLQDLTLLLLRGPTLEASLSGPGTLQFTAQQGSDIFTVLVAGTPDSAGGLVGVTVRAVSDGTAIVERSVALGSAFASRSFDVTQAERHSVTVADLAFPARFSDLRVVVTRGAQIVGSILSAGTFDFDATPGSYTLSVLAQPGASSFGTFSSAVAVNPEAPPEPPDPPPEPPLQDGGGGSVLLLPVLALALIARRRAGRHGRPAVSAPRPRAPSAVRIA